MDNAFVYEGGDRDRLISAMDCKRYAEHRLDISSYSYWKHIHPYVKQVMSHTGRKTIRKGEYMDLLNLIRRSALSIDEAVGIWLDADYWREPDEVRARFEKEIEAFG